MIGTIRPIRAAVVAHDGVKTLVMLRIKPTEALPELLVRLNRAISSAQSTGQRVDDINRPSASKTFEF